MARVTVEDCLGHVKNRFELVLVASKRARKLIFGGKEPKVPWENDKPTVVALREIAAGEITGSYLNEKTLEEELSLEMEAVPETREAPQPSVEAVPPLVPPPGEEKE